MLVNTFNIFVWSQIRDECLTCRNAVAVFDMSYFGKFYLTGPDAKKAADWLFTADVNKAPGEDLCDVCLSIQSRIQHTECMHFHFLFSIRHIYPVFIDIHCIVWPHSFSGKTNWSVIILTVCVFQGPQSTPAC